MFHTNGYLYTLFMKASRERSSQLLWDTLKELSHPHFLWPLTLWRQKIVSAWGSFSRSPSLVHLCPHPDCVLVCVPCWLKPQKHLASLSLDPNRHPFFLLLIEVFLLTSCHTLPAHSHPRVECAQTWTVTHIPSASPCHLQSLAV